MLQLEIKWTIKKQTQLRRKEPAKVIGQYGTMVFVRHGGLLVSVYKTRLKKCAESETFEKNQCD